MFFVRNNIIAVWWSFQKCYILRYFLTWKTRNIVPWIIICSSKMWLNEHKQKIEIVWRGLIFQKNTHFRKISLLKLSFFRISYFNIYILMFVFYISSLIHFVQAYQLIQYIIKLQFFRLRPPYISGQNSESNIMFFNFIN